MGNSLTHLEFQSWEDNCKTEVCSKSAYPDLTMHWVKEGVKSINDLMTSRPITGRTDFPYLDMLDAMIASALKKLLTSVHFRNRVGVEEQRAQKYDGFFRGMQKIAYTIYDRFRMQPELMQLCKVYQIYSIYAYTMITFKISLKNGPRFISRM